MFYSLHSSLTEILVPRSASKALIEPFWSAHSNRYSPDLGARLPGSSVYLVYLACLYGSFPMLWMRRRNRRCACCFHATERTKPEAGRANPPPRPSDGQRRLRIIIVAIFQSRVCVSLTMVAAVAMIKVRGGAVW